MNGFINLLKPAGMTSSDAVFQVRRLLERGTRAGHGGTLDPDAAGVLPVCVGKATRLFDYIVDKRKVYIGELCLGTVTDTDDASGRVLSSQAADVDESAVRQAAEGFVGEISQVPPAYSALKMGGVALYKKARRGESVTPEARRVHIHSIKLLRRLSPEKYLLEIECGKGVYIRSLMRDIGDKLGCGAHMSFLIRTQSGAFCVNDSLTLDELKGLSDISQAVQPMDALLGAYLPVYISAEHLKRFMDGQEMKTTYLASPAPACGAQVRLYVGGEFAGMGTVNDDGGVRVDAMLLDRQET